MPPVRKHKAATAAPGGALRSPLRAYLEPTWSFAGVPLAPEHLSRPKRDSSALDCILVPSSLHLNTPRNRRPTVPHRRMVLPETYEPIQNEPPLGAEISTTAYRAPIPIEPFDLEPQASRETRPSPSAAEARIDSQIPSTPPRSASPTLSELFEKVKRERYESTQSSSFEPLTPSTPPRAPSPTLSEVFEEVERVSARYHVGPYAKGMLAAEQEEDRGNIDVEMILVVQKEDSTPLIRLKITAAPWEFLGLVAYGAFMAFWMRTPIFWSKANKLLG